MAHMTVKWSEEGKGMEKWRRILVIVEGNMSLSRDAESRWTSIIDKMKWERKSMVRCSRRDNKNRARGDGVIVRKEMQNKSHQHVHESRTFSKRSTWCKQTLTPRRRALTKDRHELIPGHSPQTLTTRIVRKLYPRDSKHIRNQLRCDRNAHTSNASEEKRYWSTNPVHVEVKLLDKHERTGDRDVTQWLPSPTVNDRGKVGVSKIHQDDLAFRMNASSRKVLRKCLKGIIIMEPNMR